MPKGKGYIGKGIDEEVKREKFARAALLRKKREEEMEGMKRVRENEMLEKMEKKRKTITALDVEDE